MASLKKYIKRGLQYILHGQPKVIVYAKTVVLAPNEYLQDRTALITGGTSGIGYEIAKAFINAGAQVIITGRNREKVQRACEQIDCSVDRKGNIFGIAMDNTKVEDLEQHFNEALSLIGNRHIDILVNNAGVLGGHISNTNEDEWDKVFDTNLKGVFFLSRLVARYYKTNGIKGNILNIASSSSLRPAVSAYTLTKWGVRGLTLGLAKALSPYGITVNGLAPGQTATPMLGVNNQKDIAAKKNPIGRYALPEEIANMAVFLTSDMGRMIMGDIIYMTGGSGVFSNEDMNYNFV